MSGRHPEVGGKKDFLQFFKQITRDFPLPENQSVQPARETRSGLEEPVSEPGQEIPLRLLSSFLSFLQDEVLGQGLTQRLRRMLQLRRIERLANVSLDVEPVGGRPSFDGLLKCSIARTRDSSDFL